MVVGNVLKDVYLDLDSRTEKFETDKYGTNWLNLSFNASEHHFFNRKSSLGGAAISLEILQNFGLDATISNSDISFKNENFFDNTNPTHRYILIADEQISYLSPSEYSATTFTPPQGHVDYIYIDRSAELTETSTKAIIDYLNHSQSTKLVVFARNFNNRNLNSLLHRADLIFSELSDAPELKSLDTQKIVHISENKLSYLGITKNISIKRVNLITHLSIHSITSATILASFLLGYSVEDSLELARLNVENSKLDSTLTLSKLKQLAKVSTFTPKDNIELIATNLVLKPKGILAADESGGSIRKKFDQLNIPDTYENRQTYRNIFFTTPNLEKYVNGVILFDETARGLTPDGQNVVDYLTSLRIIPGIKVDQGLEKFKDSPSLPTETSDSPHPEETYTKGLDGLSDRLQEYYTMGLRFAKWRAAFEIRLDDKGQIITPSEFSIEHNCQILAEYAKTCQENNIVPIVEPELVYDGYYDLDDSISITSKILDQLFKKLSEYHVNLRACILKVNMVIAGKQFETASTPAEVGQATANVLKEHVPKELAGVVFLSGGQTVEQATNNLAEIIKNGPFPWPVTFSYARALQDPALYSWAGDNTNIDAARSAFLDRLIANTNALKQPNE